MISLVAMRQDFPGSPARSALFVTAGVIALVACVLSLAVVVVAGIVRL